MSETTTLKLTAGAFTGDRQEALYWLERRWILLKNVFERLAQTPLDVTEAADVMSALEDISREAEDVTRALIDGEGGDA